MKPVKPSISSARGASALVLSGELTEGVSDLSQAMTAPGGVPALREVNQDRSHPDSPEIEEQPHASYRQLVRSGGTQPGAVPWRVLAPPDRGEPPRPHGPATLASRELRVQAQERAAQRSQSRTSGGSSASSA